MKFFYRLCLLDTGELMQFDAARSEEAEEYDPAVFEFIGAGCIYSIQGAVPQYTDKKLLFYRKILGDFEMDEESVE